MITTGKTNDVSEYIKRRAATMTGELLAPAEFRIVPQEENKKRRIVRFHPDAETGEIFIECFAETEPHESCPANEFGRHCSHVQKAISLLLGEG